ncbi:choline transporter [Talaromyces proteolyticus]|uniref:Choline transporter n=1 Tax=Talaromyces proteolyticus TaxID=1131652 RepID=A0AAD4PXL8_9EURO|nr:choline transporter [Talaromyces proteolyticus]KAH8693271.1 choline transporter [Talaromyces proteolyticus]
MNDAVEEKHAHSAVDAEARTREPFINPSGHPQELERNFRLINICGLGITSGNTWIALGGSIVVAIYNGGPPGVIYELIATSIFYWFIAASIAELASAMPSSGGVYHWASVTAGRYGRVCGWFAGWWNFIAWIFGAASTAQIVGAQTVSMYALFHPDFDIQRWHVFVAYLICTWVCCLLVALANRAVPTIESLGGFLVLAGVFVTILVCAIMPHVNGKPYASDDFVWRDWQNETGYASNGFVFCLGMLNGAFAVGTPDVISHLAEEVPRPGRNIPLGILAQYVLGFVTALCYAIALFYSINDLDAVLKSSYLFPLTEIYVQSTGSAGGSLGLLILAFLPSIVAVIGCYLTSSRVLWTLARDNATPFSRFISQVDRKQRNPFNSIILCGVICTILGCIYVGSSTAFSAFVGSFAVLSTLSYLAAILPHLLTKRANVTPGWFWMKGFLGFLVNTVSSLYIIAFVIIFCFPFSLPVDAETMNYASLITGGSSIFVMAFWFWRKGDYVGPQHVSLESALLAEDAI